MGQYDFEEELCDSDADDYLQDEIRALSLACMPYVTSDVGGNPSTSSRGTNYGEFFEDDDDLDLVRSIKEQYGSEIDISGPLSMKPLTSLPPVSSDDDDDDFETLRAIKTRFSQYCGDDVGGECSIELCCLHICIVVLVMPQCCFFLHCKRNCLYYW